MSKKVYEVNADYRMRIVNHLKNFGYYNGILVKMDIQRKYIIAIDSIYIIYK